MSYADFLATKTRRHGEHGRDVDVTDVNPILHDWQAEIVKWTVRKGRAAIWADTGLGKTFMQIEWARLSGDRALIVAPLAVCQQTIREAAKLGVPARYLREDDGQGGLIVTNYEMASRFDPTTLDAVVLDEASILKQSDGKTRTMLINHFAPTRSRLACTATPAPNDPEELTNQAEFLGVMPRVEMLAAYFIHDDSGWRLKKHAVQPMYRWMTSWAVALRKPSDIGYSDSGYILPALNIIPEIVHVEMDAPDGQLFRADIGGVGGRAQVRKETLAERVQRAIDLVNTSHGYQISNSIGDKLTECRGSLSTKSTEKRAWPSTLNTVSESPSSAPAPHAPPRKTASTCGDTASGSPRSSRGPLSSKPFTTLSGAHGTQAIRSTANGSSVKTEAATSTANATAGCGASSALVPPNSTPWSNDRAAGAPSAELSSGTAPADASPLTTATTPAGSEGFSAPDATEGSDTSAMTTPSSSAPPTTSLEPWIIWCGLNAEQDAIAAALGDRAFSVTGSMSPEDKVDLLYRWIDGERPVMISKTSILGMGVNMQRCANMAFVGLNDSWEQYYQAIRRSWRYGQTRPVNAHIVLSQLESQIAANIQRKERQTSHMVDGLVTAMHTEWSKA